MSSALSQIPPEKRRHLAATLGLFSVLFVAVGSVAATGASTPFLKVFVIVAIVVALFLALLTWGVGASVRQDLAEQRLDAAVEDVLAASPVRRCDCGHDHDPTELHIVDEDVAAAAPADACAHDGTGVVCEHSCETCVFAELRPSPDRRRELSRPSPRPRPRPSAEPVAGPRPH